jgi:hypothetical protein
MIANRKSGRPLKGEGERGVSLSVWYYRFGGAAVAGGGGGRANTSSFEATRGETSVGTTQTDHAT